MRKKIGIFGINIDFFAMNVKVIILWTHLELKPTIIHINLEPNPNEHVLAGALQGNLQLSPNFFWNFSHHIHIFLTLSQDFLIII